MAFELFIVWKFYIETRNTPLEEIAKHFDGDKAMVGGAVATEKGRQLATEMYGEDPTEKKEPVIEQKEMSA